MRSEEITSRKFFTHFSELYAIVKSDGHTPEDVYDRLGFIKDTNYDGEVASKPDQI